MSPAQFVVCSARRREELTSSYAFVQIHGELLPRRSKEIKEASKKKKTNKTQDDAASDSE